MGFLMPSSEIPLENQSSTCISASIVSASTLFLTNAKISCSEKRPHRVHSGCHQCPLLCGSRIWRSCSRVHWRLVRAGKSPAHRCYHIRKWDSGGRWISQYPAAIRLPLHHRIGRWPVVNSCASVYHQSRYTTSARSAECVDRIRFLSGLPEVSDPGLFHF